MKNDKTQENPKLKKQAKRSEKTNDAPITASELRDMMVAEVNCLRDILQSLATIEELLKDIRSNQTTWPFQKTPINDGWDKNTTPQPPAKYWGDPPGRPRWPTDPWGNPVPYAVYCGTMEGMQCQRH